MATLLHTRKPFPLGAVWVSQCCPQLLSDCPCYPPSLNTNISAPMSPFGTFLSTTLAPPQAGWDPACSWMLACLSSPFFKKGICPVPHQVPHPGSPMLGTPKQAASLSPRPHREPLSQTAPKSLSLFPKFWNLIPLGDMYFILNFKHCTSFFLYRWRYYLNNERT